MTDRQILGLGETFTCEELKKAFRSKSKQFHPDRNSDSLNSHLAMIRLNRAYANLRKDTEEERPQAIRPETRDAAYQIYREGISQFQSIHPSQWIYLSREGLFDPAAANTRGEVPSIIRTMITRMARAYHCFSRVAEEYGNSPWHADSVRRMGEIEKMTGRYARIRESYEAEERKKNRTE